MIARGQVDLWWADLDALQGPGAHPEDWRDATRVDRRARQRLLARRSILREVLSRYLGCRPDELVLRRNSSGRPELEWPRVNLHFSVSSSETTGLFAIAYGKSIGVDVEYSWHGVGLTCAEHLFLTAAERRMVSDVEPQLRQITLLRLWTLKEALAKAMGTGLSTDPTGLEFRFEPGQMLSVPSPSGSPWRSGLISTSGDIVAALALWGDWDSCQQHRFTQDGLSALTT